MAARYDYLTLELPRGRPAWAAFTGYMRDEAVDAVARAGGELLGLFQPQLGFASNQAVVLLRWPEGASPSTSAILKAPKLVSHSHERLSATVRPQDGDIPPPGGIYVHRWFTIDGDRVADFVDISNRAWSDFEGSYATEIFGLFTAEPSVEDQREHQARMLLLTRYNDHGVWEESRAPSRDAASLFSQRHEWTRATIGRSSLLVPLRKS